MNTMVNTPTRRPSSLFGYEKIVKDCNTRVSEENAAREMAEQKAFLSAEEQKRLALEEEMTAAQKFINNLCESIQRSYMQERKCVVTRMNLKKSRRRSNCSTRLVMSCTSMWRWTNHCLAR